MILDYGDRGGFTSPITSHREIVDPGSFLQWSYVSDLNTDITYATSLTSI